MQKAAAIGRLSCFGEVAIGKLGQRRGATPRSANQGPSRRVEETAQRFVAKTPSSANCALNPAFSKRLATSRGTSRPLVSLFGLPV